MAANWVTTGDRWGGQGLEGLPDLFTQYDPFFRDPTYQVVGTGGAERMAQMQALYDQFRSAADVNTQGVADYIPGFTPDDLFSLLNPPSAPGVAAPAAQNVAAVDAAAGKASGRAREEFANQQVAGATQANEIAAAKGKTSGSGAQRIAQGINDEAQQNLDRLLSQIMGVQQSATQDVQNLGQASSGLFDAYQGDINNLAVANQGIYNQALGDRSQQATDVLNSYSGLYDPYNAQAGELAGTQGNIMDQLIAEFAHTNWQGATPTPVYDPSAYTAPSLDFSSDIQGLGQAAGSLNLPQAPSLDQLRGQVDQTQPDYQKFSSLQLPEYGAADLNPYIDQFDTFKLDELQSLGGGLNQNIGGEQTRGGRAQWNIQGYDPMAQYQNQDWLQTLMASLGQGGLF